MNKNPLLKNLEKVERIASASKLNRMLMHPFKYLNAILFREVIYKFQKTEKKVASKTFFDTKMTLLLPSSTDIYLTCGKSHDSEIRLAKFLINNLGKDDSFVDVGAHYGYFSLLGSKLSGNNGSVFSFEASPSTYKILKENTRDKANIRIFNLAVSDEASTMKFFEFPNLYSEYNTLYIDQFRSEKWFSKYRPKEINVESVVLDEFLIKEEANPKIIKIDVEGAEDKVIKGLRNYLTSNSPYIVMEYLSQKRGNVAHREAERNLKALGYFPFIIDTSGSIQRINSISAYLEKQNLESDNIVFSKKEGTC